MKNKNNNKAGYTIIETMISISVFLVVVMSGMGALVNANLIHEKSADMRSIMDNLNFIMEDMSRNLRTGYNYHCFSGNVPTGEPLPQSCSGGGPGIFFISTNSSAEGVSNWAYLKGDTADGLGIYKYVDGSTVQLTPDEVDIDSASGFLVVGAESGGPLQPLVTIRLVGKITLKGVVTPFSLQTTVSQRLIDI